MNNALCRLVSFWGQRAEVRALEVEVEIRAVRAVREAKIVGAREVKITGLTGLTEVKITGPISKKRPRALEGSHLGSIKANNGFEERYR